MRSKLFVPASHFDLFAKALTSGADAVCFDLEDGVAPAAKPSARDNLTTFLCAQPYAAERAAGAPLLIVRTNHAGSPDFALDLAAALWPSVSALALPKVESAEELIHAAEMIASVERDRDIVTPLGLLPTIESARGLRQAAEIAQSSGRILGLQIGFADLLEPLGIAPTNLTARDQIRLMLRLAAAEAEVDCYDSAFADFSNAAAYQQHLDAGAALGFAGTSCIHPKQVAAANLAYTPSPEALAHARRVIAAAQEAQERGAGVTTLDGKMIDRPFMLAAERLLARSRAQGDPHHAE
jgi:citrate lyase beta subunit